LPAWVALLLALSLVAAACGSDGDDDAAGVDDTESTEEGGGDDGEPVRGGTLVYAVDSDTANAWAPYRASLAISGYIPLGAVADPLVAIGADLSRVPVLAESIEPNEDFTEWTFEIREGIEFHDGTPLDGEAVKFNMETCVGSPLAGPAFTNVGEITAEGQTVTVSTTQGPWVVLPNYFAGACGYMFSADWLRSLDDVPQRQEGNRFYDAALAATPGGGDPAAPVGTGAFVFESYAPGNGNTFKAVRNEDYWRGDGEKSLTDEGLPYLDAVEIVVAVDVDSRVNTLRAGQADVIHTANTDTIAEFLEDDEFNTVASDEYGETGYILMNVAQGNNLMTGAPLDPEGANADNPLTTLACRKALAHAIDYERFADERGGGITRVANGPFPPGSIGYLEDTGFPAYDVPAAQAEMETCLAERGTESISFDYNTTNDPFNVESNALIISMWKEAFGNQVDASITPIEQGQYIGFALTGAFQAVGWRSHSGTDPDSQLLWWISAAASPIGELALNFGRMSDPVIDENLITVRTNPDADTRREAAEAINKRFAEQVYAIWLYWGQWGILSHPYVHDTVPTELPFDEEGIPSFVSIRQMWCDGGECG
jgi:peptide/nickel transport system substrate-binding protein